MLNYSGDLLSRKLARFAIEVERGGSLLHRSKLLLADLYFVAGYLYDKLSCSILSDSAFDRLVLHILGDYENIRQSAIAGYEHYLQVPALKTGTSVYPPEIGGLAMDALFVFEEMCNGSH